jgi:hypothetical protein
MVKERPILFNGQMVRAIRDGRKTQTRRLVKPQPRGIWESGVAHRGNMDIRSDAFHVQASVQSERRVLYCPYGKPGDRLWVRETWYCDRLDDPHSSLQEKQDELYYRADVPSGRFEDAGYWSETGSYWRPSIHMPRWASRINLEITGVRIDRLKELSDQDAISEGIEQHPTGAWLPCREVGKVNLYPVPAFRDLWDSIASVGADWAANPWVWVIEFKEIKP